MAQKLIIIHTFDLQAYWRLKGFSGEIVTTDPRPGQALPGALSIVYDATSDQGHPALVGFIGGDQATVWADKSVGNCWSF